jgi:DNA-binding NarL/FixJ family response regulator
VTVRVLIADDTEFMREGLRMALEPSPAIEVVGEAADGATAVEEARRLRPDVVLMDIRMPGLDGIEATRRIVALDGAPVRVLMLTTFDLVEYLLEGLNAGVSGFALKDTPPDDLLAGILAVARGDALVDAAATAALIERVTHRYPPSPPPAGLDRLTARERDVLELVAAGHPNSEIGAELGIDDASVEADVAKVLATLGVRERAHAVLVAHQSRLTPAARRPPSA